MWSVTEIIKEKAIIITEVIMLIWGSRIIITKRKTNFWYHADRVQHLGAALEHKFYQTTLDASPGAAKQFVKQSKTLSAVCPVLLTSCLCKFPKIHWPNDKRWRFFLGEHEVDWLLTVLGNSSGAAENSTVLSVFQVGINVCASFHGQLFL